MKSRSGMTLLELLIAAALIAVAALVVAQAFAAGFRVWYRASQLGGNYADSVIALEAFHQDVRNTIPCRGHPFRGGENWMEIPSLIRLETSPLHGSSQEGRLTEGNTRGAQPGLIRYDVDVPGKRLQRAPTATEIAGRGDVARRETLAEGVESITFLYADRVGNPPLTLVWERVWEGRTNNPAAVQVKWRGQQGGETFEFERIISLPCR